jgi:hypothetical protein
VKVLAAFASSDAGRVYGRVCEMWGVDPAASLEEVDDVLAANLRVALAFSMNKSEPEEVDMVDKARRAGTDIRRRMGG